MSQPPNIGTARKGKSFRFNRYDHGTELSDEQIAAGAHRKRVGGRWEKIGRLQFDFLCAQGLAPESYLLDVACGALRGGVHFVNYLAPGHYFGIDLSDTLLRAGLEHELPQAGLADRLPPENLRATDRFDCEFGVTFDFALALSLFTHVPLNHIRLCLYQVAKVMAPGGRFFATFYEAPKDLPFDQPMGARFPDKDPYLYRTADLEWAGTSVADWEFRYIGPWGHPLGQCMVEYRRPRSSRRIARVPERVVRKAARVVPSRR